MGVLLGLSASHVGEQCEWMWSTNRSQTGNVGDPRPVVQATGTKWFSTSVVGDAKASPWACHCCMKCIEIWQKINPVAFQLILGYEGWAVAGLNTDYSQFSNISLIMFSKKFHENKFTNSAVSTP